MGLFKCKCCGAELHVKDGDKVVTCDYCGSTQTIPNSQDANVLSVYMRGNSLRNQGEFDKAYAVFSKLSDSESSDAEIYWNLLLCKYGVTYVDDYDGKKKPTMNRVSLSSILDDHDYLKALSLSDALSKEAYVEEANRIAKIQDGIIKVIKKEKPYDVFISYKESDEFGNRTEDSVLAQDVYEKLTEKGYRVFLSRITLSSLVGHDYEPYIYSALYTSKALILVSCSVDYMNAPWVKNEWQRYIFMMQKDKSKALIPCYKGVAPYDFPKEIRNFQGIDMGKLGWMQDLCLGVDKTIGGKSRTAAQAKGEPDEARASLASLIKRAGMLIDEGSLKEAAQKIDHILDLDPENPDAHVLNFKRLFLSKGVKPFIEKAFENDGVPEDFTKNSSYQNALKFGGEKAKDELEAFLSSCYRDIVFYLREEKNLKELCRGDHKIDGSYRKFEVFLKGRASEEEIKEIERKWEFSDGAGLLFFNAQDGNGIILNANGEIKSTLKGASSFPSSSVSCICLTEVGDLDKISIIGKDGTLLFSEPFRQCKLQFEMKLYEVDYVALFKRYHEYLLIKGFHGITFVNKGKIETVASDFSGEPDIDDLLSPLKEAEEEMRRAIKKLKRLRRLPYLLILGGLAAIGFGIWVAISANFVPGLILIGVGIATLFVGISVFSVFAIQKRNQAHLREATYAVIQMQMLRGGPAGRRRGQNRHLRLLWLHPDDPQ